MDLKRTFALARKEWVQIRRDPFSLALAFLLPVMLLVIYGYAITFDVNNLATVVYDQDKSSLSREFVDQFIQSGYFTQVASIGSYMEVDPFLDKRKAKVVIVIPVDFSKKIHSGAGTSIEAIIDGSDANTASIAQGYIAIVVGRFTTRLAGQQVPALVNLQPRVWYNPELKSRHFIIPGLIAVIMAVIVALLTSLTISREWERGTMEQLVSTPVKPIEMVTGKLIPYFIIGFIDTVASILMGTLLFDVPLRSSITLLLLSSGIFLFGGLSFGILISIATRNQVLACQAAIVSSFLPAFLLSGFIFSISNMPHVLQAITFLIPARYFVSILKGIFLKGIGFTYLRLELLLLSVYAALVFFLAVKKLKKRID